MQHTSSNHILVLRLATTTRAVILWRSREEIVHKSDRHHGSNPLPFMSCQNLVSFIRFSKTASPLVVASTILGLWARAIILYEYEIGSSF